MEERGAPAGAATRPLADLRSLVARIDPGARIAYVTDALHSEENARRIVALARNADLFYCEAMFLEKDAQRAKERFHLTARQAGLLARRAGWGAIVGGLIGAFAGVPVPIVGPMIGAFAGAFVGALAAEYTVDRDAREATRAAVGALVGRAAAVAVKVAIGCVMLTWLLLAAWT